MKLSHASRRANMATSSLSSVLPLLLLSSLSSAHTFRGRDVSLQEAEDATPIYNARLQRCPQACSIARPDSTDWTTYTDPAELAVCEETILFTTDLYALVSDENAQTYIKACTTSDRGSKGMTAGEFRAAYLDDEGMPLASPREDVIRTHKAARAAAERRTLAERDDQGDAVNCGAVPKTVNLEVEEAWHGESTIAQHHKSATLELARYFEEGGVCGQTVMFAAAGGLQAVVGVMAGGDVAKPSLGAAIRSFSGQIGGASSYIRQSCGRMSHGEGWGIAADMKGDISAIQTALGTWAKGQCLSSASFLGGSKKEELQMTVLTSGFDDDTTDNTTTASNATSSRRSPLQALANLMPRADCRDIQVQKDDSCGSLAKRCGISGANFEKFNSKKKDLCSTLQEKQFVCCSAGDLPVRTPQANKDGTCFAYTVKDTDDGCWAVADKHYLTSQDLETFNKKTWGWGGCANLLKKQTICLSKGDPPMPTVDKTALCGPTVPGTKRPSDWSKIASLNPCPINACCNVWGQCGVTKDFCVKAEIPGGGPGTSMPGKNGCVSSCGTGIKNNDDPGKGFRMIGYFEAWNHERKCLHMDVSQIPLNRNRYVHFAFATITPDFKVELKGEVKKQFDKLKAMGDKFTSKKILSFGGWAFSNDHGTSPIFRQSVSPANRALFAERVVQFLKDNSLDGLDFDWEYPGANDIPGSVPGHKEDGANYLSFLEEVKKRLPEGKTLSIALPASYWYLRNFPVAKMAKVVDYFIFMTYDLHGQWDYGSKHASPDCPQGSCIRSHINMTETMDALGMVTRAGVMSHQVVVGISSYGRSFKMADPSCTGYYCKFTGSNTTSNAEKGECTDTAGYIADAEIKDIILGAHMGDDIPNFKKWYDEKSQSDIMTWRGNWVAYMSEEEKTDRLVKYMGLNMGGWSDWAVDLTSFNHALPGDDGYYDEDDENYGSSIEPCEKEYKDLTAVADDASNIPSHCWSFYTLNALTIELDKALESYEKVKEDYDGKFGWYRRYINDMVDPKIRDWLNDRENPKGGGDLTGKGNKFFKCKYKEHGQDKWRYEGDCPIPDSARTGRAAQEIEYTIKNEKDLEEGLLKDLGIPLDWLRFGTVDHGYSCDGQMPPCTSVPEEKYKFPLKKDKIDVPNPKDIMIAAQKNMTSLRDQLDAAIMTTGLGLYQGNDADAAIALGSPVGQIVQAVASMDNVKEIGDEVEEQHKKELILSIVGLVLMIVPLVGEVGAALAGMTRLARFAFIAGELGNGAMDMIDIIENPETAPMVIAGMLFGLAGDKLDSSKRFNNAANVRRGLDGNALDGMGKSYKGIDTKVNKVCDRCA